MTTPRLLTLLAIAILLAACNAKEPAATIPITGSTAPDFTLPDAHGGSLTLSQLKKPTLIVFYLGYDCPRCVRHLRDLANHKADFDKLNVQILAISPDPVATTQQSIHEFGDFPFPLLADADKKVAAAYGMLVNNNQFHGVYVLDADRKIRFAQRTDHPFADIEKLLQLFK